MANLSDKSIAINPTKRLARGLVADMRVVAQDFGLKLIADGGLVVEKHSNSQSIADNLRLWFGGDEGKRETANPRLLVSRCRRQLNDTSATTRAAISRVNRRLQPLVSELSLDGTEIGVLLLAMALRSDHVLSKLFDNFKYTPGIEHAHVLERVMNGGLSKLLQVLDSRGRLHGCGLLCPPKYCHGLSDTLTISSSLFAAFYADGALLGELLGRILTTAAASACLAENFRHVDADIAVLESALKQSSRHAHVLLAGPPGVGKTELARLVGQRLDWSAFEVDCIDKEGMPANRQERFANYSMAIELLRSSPNTLIIFDEAEDVFVGDHWVHVEQSKERHKGWTSRLMEAARVPTIWITNSIDRVDPAYLRRFDHIVQLRSPPRSVRRQLIGSAAAGLAVSPSHLDDIADCENFTPADAARVARLLPLACAGGLRADQGLRKLATARPGSAPRGVLGHRRADSIPYRLEWLNVDVNLESLIGQLTERGAGTLAFLGPPGTGKTALAKHLATALDRPLLAKKASDLIRPYLGETEERIARAFEDAGEDGAVLFLDEADSFVRDRGLALRSWEVTQVNEVLAQLDSYRGIAIMASNFSDTLDRALQRRLDVKINFGFLRPEQAWSAFQACLNSLGIQCPSDESGLATRLHALRELALGDFVAASRGLSLLNLHPTAEQFFKLAEQEVRLKGGGRRPIGFGIA